jgi:hypothetical protein
MRKSLQIGGRMRRVLQNLIAAAFGGLLWLGYTYLLIRNLTVWSWQTSLTLVASGFCLVLASTSIVDIIIKEDRVLKVEVVKDAK